MHKYFSLLFKASSFITPVFLGVTLGAMMMGDISTANSGSFYERFVHPWFNGFCFTLGIFVASLFGYIAAVFLVSETKGDEQKKYIRLSKLFLGLTIILGSIVFIVAEMKSQHLFNGFFHSPVSITVFILAIVLIPVIFYLFSHPRSIYLRAVIALQVTLILLGWFAIHYPVIVYLKDSNPLTFFNSNAPDATLLQLFIALITGLLLVLPGLYFLFKVFKKTD
jgi:cytochrome d ubiquinol oxidase subunit II